MKERKFYYLKLCNFFTDPDQHSFYGFGSKRKIFKINTEKMQGNWKIIAWFLNFFK